MSIRIPTFIAAAVAAIAAAGCASVAEGGQDKVLVVLGGTAAQAPALIEQGGGAAPGGPGEEKWPGGACRGPHRADGRRPTGRLAVTTSRSSPSTWTPGS